MTFASLEQSSDVNPPAIAPVESAISALNRGIPQLNLRTVRSLQQAISSLRRTIASMEQELLLLKAQYDEVQQAAKAGDRLLQQQAIALKTQLQEKEQRLVSLQTSLHQATLKLSAMQV